MNDQQPTVETVDAFRQRASQWVEQNLEPSRAVSSSEPGFGEAIWRHGREQQRALFAAGFAGLCFPREYGGQGLTVAHQRAFNELVAGYQMPTHLNTPNISICAATILDMGTEDQKREFIPRVLSGEIIFCQFLSEAGGGSDLAAVTTRADREGDSFILNGSKTWSSAAYAADYALCLTRTDWSVPKHRGTTMFILPIRTPGVEVRRIKQVNGHDDFCEEFLDDVIVPAANVLGEINGGWSVVSRQLFHERNSVGGGSPFVSGAAEGGEEGAAPSALIDLLRRSDRTRDTWARELVAESYALSRIQHQLAQRVMSGVGSEQLPGTAGSIIRLFAGSSSVRRSEIEIELAGMDGSVATPGEHLSIGMEYLFRQGTSLGGGSTEMARNIISERVLGMPREFAADRDLPFSQVKRGRD